MMVFTCEDCGFKWARDDIDCPMCKLEDAQDLLDVVVEQNDALLERLEGARRALVARDSAVTAIGRVRADLELMKALYRPYGDPTSAEPPT